jgi:hypothetical protein
MRLFTSEDFPLLKPRVSTSRTGLPLRVFKNVFAIALKIYRL